MQIDGGAAEQSPTKTEKYNFNRKENKWNNNCELINFVWCEPHTLRFNTNWRIQTRTKTRKNRKFNVVERVFTKAPLKAAYENNYVLFSKEKLVSFGRFANYNLVCVSATDVKKFLSIRLRGGCCSLLQLCVEYSRHPPRTEPNQILFSTLSPERLSVGANSIHMDYIANRTDAELLIDICFRFTFADDVGGVQQRVCERASILGPAMRQRRMEWLTSVGSAHASDSPFERTQYPHCLHRHCHHFIDVSSLESSSLPSSTPSSPFTKTTTHSHEQNKHRWELFEGERQVEHRKSHLWPELKARAADNQHVYV